MPSHGHGLPTRPEVTAHLDEGRYRIEGLRFNMPGDWTLVVEVEAPPIRDRMQFLLRLAATPGDWDDRERALLASLRLPSNLRPPPSPSNPVADDPRAIQLGQRLFHDRRLSRDGRFSCASCHQPDRAFTDGRPRGQGVGVGLRNTPTLIGAAFQTWFYWDGRRDSLWSQALIPWEAPDEMGSSRLEVVRVLLADSELRTSFETVFGAIELPERRLPEQGGPYAASPAARRAWEGLSTADRDAVNRVFANLGRAVAAYERTLLPTPSRFDAYVDQVLGGRAPDGWSDLEQRGLQLFLADENRCLRCHNGPHLTNGGFHNIGTGSFSGPHLDFGRVFGRRAVLMDEFNCRGRYSPASDAACAALRFLGQEEDAHLTGAFKVPSLRNLKDTGPYFHDGRHDTLEDVVRYYRDPGVDGVEIEPLALDDDDVAALSAFLRTL
jgi:cytochrome c peroxidase